MKKIASLLLVVAIGLSAAACDPKTFFSNVGSVLTMSTASISNPVTKEMLNDAENAGILIFAGLKAYKKTCVDLVIPQSCRGVIQKIQVYTRKLKAPDGSGVLKNLRSFVKNNDQVNAVIAYNAAMQLMADIRTIATSNNVQVQ